MTQAQSHTVEQLVTALREGSLTEDGLRAGAAELAGDASRCQELMIVETSSSCPSSRIAAMKRFADGAPQVLPDDPEQWPYATPLEAVRDGWRIIAFPELALQLVGDDEWHGLGFRFVLER